MAPWKQGQGHRKREGQGRGAGEIDEKGEEPAPEQAGRKGGAEKAGAGWWSGSTRGAHPSGWKRLDVLIVFAGGVSRIGRAAGVLWRLRDPRVALTVARAVGCR